MPRLTLDQLRSIADFSSTYRWVLNISKFPSVGGPYPDSEEVDIRCETSSIPQLTGTSTEVTVRGHKVKTPGIYNYDGVLTLTFFETADNKIKDFLKNWREACWQTRTGIQNKKEDVEAEIILHLLNNADEEVYEYKLIGCFLENVDYGTLDGTTADPIKPSATISYDYFEDKSLI